MRRALAASFMTLVVFGCAPAPSASPTAGSSSSPVPAPSAHQSQTAQPTTLPFVNGWRNATADAIGDTADWSNKVELADIDGNGTVDLLFANGGDYEVPGTPVASRAFRNDGSGTFADATEAVFGDLVGLTRVIKARDVNADGLVDLFLGNTFDTQSHLLLGVSDGTWEDVTDTNLPKANLSVGDLELGDVDLDGDLDAVLADWGDGNPFEATGRVQLWRNNGSGRFSDATAERMPESLIGFSWEIELLDVDNDWDLDLAVSCKVCRGSSLFENDGKGAFTDVTDGRMPAFPNNYEFTPIDLDSDGFLDLVTINDGEEGPRGYPEHVFRNTGSGGFEDATNAWWSGVANAGFDDNIAVAIDIESDGDADFFIGSLDGPDRLLLNDGTGVLSVVSPLYDSRPSGGTLGWAVADLNGDARPDLVESQGEVAGHEAEQVYIATDAVPPDAAPPVIAWESLAVGDGEAIIVARVHDNRTPNMPHDWRLVEFRPTGGPAVPLMWYGENLFRTIDPLPDDAVSGEVCATDAAGNEACA